MRTKREKIIRDAARLVGEKERPETEVLFRDLATFFSVDVDEALQSPLFDFFLA
jgi:hypothetical protein